MTRTRGGYVGDWERARAALSGEPYSINTQPQSGYPDWAWRRDAWHHAYINLFTERWRSALGRDPGDELSKRLGQITGILLSPVALPLAWIIARTTS